MCLRILIRRHLIFLWTLTFSITLLACSPSDEFSRSTKIRPDSSLIRVGVSADAPPLIYKKNGKFTGLEADFARQFSRYTGKRVKFIEFKKSEQIKALEDNEIDIIMSGISITPAMQSRIAFSTPYLRAGQIMLVRLQDKALFSTGIYTLTNSTYIIGTVQNTPGENFVNRSINDVQKVSFMQSGDAVQALIEKKIDVFIYDAPMICHYAANDQNKMLIPILTLATEEFLAWGIRKDDHELLAQANEFLLQLERRQELPRMIRNWIPFM